MIKKEVVILGPMLGLFHRDAQPPQVSNKLNDEQGARVMLSQLLVMSLQSNTYDMIKAGTWPGKADRLVPALYHRVDELYGRFFTNMSNETSEWLNLLSSLIEGAMISIQAIALQQDPRKTLQLHKILKDLALLAGTYSEDAESIYGQADDLLMEGGEQL